MDTGTEVQSLALDNDWLTTTGGSETFTNFHNTVYPWYYNPWPYQTITTTWPSTEIVLKMSEVERLRVAAKDDKKVKKILEKFTHLIRVEVDFD